MKSPAPINPPARVLMGPGPSEVPASILRALAMPTIGHLDPVFLAVMDEIRTMLTATFRTKNALTFPMSGTGSAGMETCFANLVEPGDRVLVGKNGVFGTRMIDVAARCGAEVTAVEGVWGRALEADAFRAAAKGGSYKIVAIVHAETSTGVLQDLLPIREVADELGALLLVDTVTSLGGTPVEIDAWKIDAAYSGTQKCLSCPPGLSPITFSSRAEHALASRKRPVPSWYLDLSMIRKYWGAERAYHHTAPINMLYALHESLRLVLEEGLDARFARHRTNSAALVSGLEALGLTPKVVEKERLPQLVTVAVPDDVDDRKTRRALLDCYGIEIGGGLGPMAGNTWRFGLMGASCTRKNVVLCLSALRDVLARQGHRTTRDPIEAARVLWGDEV